MSAIGITNLSGKAGGSIFSHNQGGSYVKNFAVPANPQTADQQGVRSLFGGLSSAWRGLTKAERDSWKAASASFPYKNAFGDVTHLSGFGLHQSLNRNLQVVGSATIGNAPTPQGVDAVASLSLVATSDDVTFTGEFTVSGTVEANATATTAYAVYASPMISAGISNAKNRLRLIGVLDSTAFVAGEDMISAYTAKFGATQAAAKAIINVVAINTTTGERGAAFYANSIVVPATT